MARLLRLALDKYQRDDCATLAASLAYFALFSFFPLILVSISLVGFFIDPDAFEVRRLLLGVIGSPELRDLVRQTLEHFNQNRVNAGLIGFVTLFFGAAGVFGALDRAFDVIWEVRRPEGRGWLASLRRLVLDRLVAFALVLGLAALLLTAVVANVAIEVAGTYTGELPRSDLLRNLAQLLLTLLLTTAAMAALFKVLPGRRTAWGDVWPAALVTAALFSVLQGLAGFVFANINFSSYGAVGGAMTLLLWIYLCCQVILVGAELAFAWTRVYGSRRDQDPA
jgi:membrane protein